MGCACPMVELGVPAWEAQELRAHEAAQGNVAVLAWENLVTLVLAELGHGAMVAVPPWAIVGVQVLVMMGAQVSEAQAKLSPKGGEPLHRLQC